MYTGECNKQEGKGRTEKEGEWRIGEELARQQKIFLKKSIKKIVCETQVFRTRTEKPLDKEMRHRA